MTDKKGFILNHQEDGLCFIEAPEKPDYKNFIIHNNYRVEVEAYNQALELAIANRMKIVNPDLVTNVFELEMSNKKYKIGEMYPWAGTIMVSCTRGCGHTVPCTLMPRDKCGQFVRLIAPEQNDTNVTLLSKQQFNSPENQNRDKAIVGFKPVVEPVSGESDFEPFGPEWDKEMMKLPKKAIIDLYRRACQEQPVSLPSANEDQEELWREVAQHLNAQLEKEQVPIEYFEAIREQFTITRNP